MDVKTTVMSEKGQVVIPDLIRKKLNATKGTMFVVLGENDTILLKKMQTPSKAELLRGLKALTREVTDELKKKGITEEEVIRIAVAGRRKQP